MPAYLRRCYIFKLLLMACVLSACGYHLRGAYQLPQHLSPIYLNKDSMSLLLYKELRTALKASGSELAKDRSEAASELRVIHEQRSRDVLSVDSQGRAREYGLKYSVSFSLMSNGEAVIDNSNILLSRTLLCNPDAVLGTEQEQANVYNDMIRDGSSQILLRLQALK